MRSLCLQQCLSSKSVFDSYCLEHTTETQIERLKGREEQSIGKVKGLEQSDPVTKGALDGETRNSRDVEEN